MLQVSNVKAPTSTCLTARYCAQQIPFHCNVVCHKPRVSNKVTVSRTWVAKWLVWSTGQLPNLTWNMTCLHLPVGLGNVVDIATHYGLDHPGIETCCRQDFSHPSGKAQGSSQTPLRWVLGCFPVSSADVEERVALLFYSPLNLHGT
jgi:hypothetical protein